MYYSKSSTLLITIYTIMSLLIIVSPLSEIFCLSHIDPPIFNFLRQPTYKYNGKYHHITIFFSFDISVYACIWYRYQTSRILLTCTYYMEFKINKKNMPALVVQFNFFNSIFLNSIFFNLNGNNSSSSQVELLIFITSSSFKFPIFKYLLLKNHVIL